jgi:hypothetical protein
MGSILTPALDAIRASAIKANGVRGYLPQHNQNGGECALTLGTLPVLVRYELTFDGCDEIAEVVAVSIGGHEIDAGDFAADIRAAWGAECMSLRGGL